MKSLLFIFLFCQGFKLFSMCKILLLPGNIGSHLIFFGRLAEELLSRNHNVVMVVGSRTTIPQEVLKLPNLTLKTFQQKSAPFTELKEYKEPLINSAFTQSVWDILNANGNLFRFHTRDGLFLLEDSALMQNISNEGFDFVILDYVIPPFLILPYKLGIPYSLIGLSPPLLARRQTYFPSFVPTPTSFYGDNMNFRQRFINFLHSIYFAYIQRPYKRPSNCFQVCARKTCKRIYGVDLWSKLVHHDSRHLIRNSQIKFTWCHFHGEPHGQTI